MVARREQPAFAARLEISFPVGGRDVTVRSADVGRLLEAKAVLLPALEQLAKDAPAIFDGGRMEAIFERREASAEDIADLCVLLERADVAVDLVALLTPMPREQVLELMPDEFAYLFAVLAQVNADFFVRALPVMKSAWARIGGALEGNVASNGATSSASANSGTSSSPQPATA